MNGKIIFAALFVALFLLTGVASAYSSGDGSVGSPYQISNKDDLITLSTDSGNWGQNFVLTADIDIPDGESPTSTIGISGTTFTGSFDGQGHTIRNFEMNKPDDVFVGLFGYLGSGGEIKKLGIEAGVSGVCGLNIVGVLVGNNDGGSITNCYATGDAHAQYSFTGGLVGINDGGSITNCFATGDAYAKYGCDSGGLVGINDGGSITNCFATGDASDVYKYVGGLVGSNDGGSITNCYRYVDYGNKQGTHISDLSKFKDYSFLTGTTENNGLRWSTDIISTEPDSSKVWYVPSSKTEYPTFQRVVPDPGTPPICFIPTVELTAPTGRIPANGSAEFAVTADNLDNITELSFTITYDPALITIEDIAPAHLVETADFAKTIDNTDGRITVTITDDEGITSDTAAPVTDITFRATETITGLRETTQLTITDANSQKSGQDCPVVREDGAIHVEARTNIGAPNSTLPVESSKYLTVSASGLNDVKNISFIMEFNRTVMSVIDVRANGTVPGLTVESTIINENGWLEINAEAPDTITGIESIPLVDINVHSRGLPGLYELDLIRPCWTRDNVTYRFDDMEPGVITISPVDTAFADDQPVAVSNMTFDDDTQEVSINLSANRHASIIDDNTTILVRNPGIDITIRTNGLENVSSEWTGECTGAEIGNISGAADLEGDVGSVATGISANISGSLSALTNPDTGLNVSITRGAVDETMGRLFQLGVLDQMGAELEEVAYTMEINKSAFGDITVTDALIVMSAPECYVNAWGGADNFTILSMTDDGEVTLLETTYTFDSENGIYTFTALSPDGFSFKSLVAYTLNKEPLAQLSAVPVEGSAPLAVQFYDYSDGHPSSWAWDFGDGNTSVEQNTVHTYTAVGEYAVSLTITNVMGEDTVEEAGYITVTNSMTVDFTASQTMGYAPLAVTFTDQTTGTPTSWLWDFGDGETSVQQNPEHTYERAGTYSVSLTATNVYGSVTCEKEQFITATYHHVSDGDDNPAPYVAPTLTPVPTTITPTPEATATTPPGTLVSKPAVVTGTTELPVGPGGEVEGRVTLWANDLSGYLTIDAGVVARDASGNVVDTVGIVAVPVTTIPSSGEIGAIERPRALYVFNCTPVGATFLPAISLTFTLTEDEWNRYGNEAEVGWFNSTSEEWEIVAGVPDPAKRTITIPVSHFSTYALFADAVPEVPLPDMTGMPAGESGCTPLWVWGGLLIAVLVMGGILRMWRKREE